MMLLIIVIIFSYQSLMARSKAIMEFNQSERQRSELPKNQGTLFEKLHGSEKTDDQTTKPRNVRRLRSPDKNYNEYNKLLDRQIAELKRIYQMTKSPQNRAELLLRLAELYNEKSDLTKTIIDQQASQAASRGEKVTIDYSAAHVFNQQAIKLYERFVQDYPNDLRIDQALFFLGFNYFELDNPEKGMSYFNRLNSEYPKSRYIIES
ncbi:MAG: tetratricopeptide repeat protein, partial [Bdellovibrionaceae bacterium]|nr:tetratricopeptide repeat protein [Pseudobdellovibrionaceae bacterium]